MRIGRPVIIIGIIVLIMGTIFHFQGQSVIGPQSSFMYSNPEWITYGTQIAIGGIIMIAIGIGIRMKKSS